MDCVHDIICSLLEVPFSRRSDKERRDIVNVGRPTTTIDIILPSKNKEKTFSRYFKTSWYDKHKWLCGSYFKNSLFCWPCLLLSSNRQSVWVSRGYCDLKNLSAAVKKHESSKDHMSNFLSLKNFIKNKSTIVDALAEHSSFSLRLYNEDVRKNRKLLGYLLDVCVLLGKQELAFRGHDEKPNSLNQGNFKEVFYLIINNDDEIKDHIKKNEGLFTGLSKSIQNDLIESIAQVMTDEISNEINNALFFSIQADDTTDIVEKSQCALSIRYVNKNGIITERFLGFYDVSEDRTARALYNLISNILSKFKDYSSKLVGQCYDGASVMAGEISGLQKLIKDDAPNAMFTHCFAHRLNLVLQHGSKCISRCRIFFATLTSIPSYFHQSAKRTFILNHVMGKRIPVANETRWSSRSKIIHIVNSEWTNLKAVFSAIVGDSSSSAESVNGARGYIKNLNNFEFAFLTTVYNEIFGTTDVLFDILQKKIIRHWLRSTAG